jgi:hypothetical protein
MTLLRLALGLVSLLVLLAGLILEGDR